MGLGAPAAISRERVFRHLQEKTPHAQRTGPGEWQGSWRVDEGKRPSAVPRVFTPEVLPAIADVNPDKYGRVT